MWIVVISGWIVASGLLYKLLIHTAGAPEHAECVECRHTSCTDCPVFGQVTSKQIRAA